MFKIHTREPGPVLGNLDPYSGTFNLKVGSISVTRTVFRSRFPSTDPGVPEYREIGSISVTYTVPRSKSDIKSFESFVLCSQFMQPYNEAYS